GTSNRWVLIVAVVVSGAFVGLNNTLMTQAVMLVSRVERPIASAAYGFVRFIGGGLAPFCAGLMAAAWSVHVPFLVGAGVLVLAMVVLRTVHARVEAADHKEAEMEEADEPDEGPAPGLRGEPA
ncbi:MAG: MFS transporter, partial [Solirubrobacteraceae bacterium]